MLHFCENFTNWILLQNLSLFTPPTYLHALSILNRDKLLRNDRQHLNVDTVELIKTTPGARLSQTGEESTHDLVIQTVGAIEHHALLG